PGPQTSELATKDDTLDLRDRKVRGSAKDQVLAEWLGKPDESRDRTSTAPSNASETHRRAAEAAQRAVDDRVVPSRYDRLIERYFRTLPKKVLPAPEAAK
ncbi:MAG: hypothetical protein ACT4PL_13000, partial [Phycisphaerales bacterium]